MTTLEILHEPPAWGLPAASPASLNALLYAEVAGIKYIPRISIYPNPNVTGPLPALKWGHHVIPASRLVSYLQRDHCDLNQYRTAQEKSDIHAYTVLLEDQLTPVAEYLQWLHEDSVKAARAYAAQVPFPVDRYLRWQKRREVKRDLTHHHLAKFDEIMSLATSVYDTMSIRLSTHKYLFGARPSSIDVLLASHLAIHYHIPTIEENPFKTLLDTKYPNLVTHFQLLLQKYFTEYQATFQGIERTPPEFKASSSTEVTEPKPAVKTPAPPVVQTGPSIVSASSLVSPELLQRRNARLGLMMGAASVIAYALYYRQKS